MATAAVPGRNPTSGIARAWFSIFLEKALVRHVISYCRLFRTAAQQIAGTQPLQFGGSRRRVDAKTDRDHLNSFVVQLGSLAALILMHNHPSGDPKPSRDDIEMAHEMRKAAEVLGVAIHDHMAMSRNRLR